jgi:hypothetical protein
LDIRKPGPMHEKRIFLKENKHDSGRWLWRGKKLYAFASLLSVRDIHTKVWLYHTRGCCWCYYHTPSLTIKVLFVTQWGVLDHNIVMIIRNRNSNSWVHLEYRSRSWSWE